ncbi:hypothetical protein ATI61_103204 [Archangium gephyra]|uniref:Uncharacterized protein n=1 Tax=Archangium gephyra TaxID=48 RepID=A0AAC8Q5P7_9BACT|nr:hypothetical protein [Archangium gephyra]AKJ01496.1 Hypothetical protein AA314_03122 [Archangium gephyra]REG34311.1 hypothetical protein ATI61_103204 [Archangium gephyra]
MTQDDKDIITPTTENHPDKRKGQMTIREAAAMEMPQHHMETGIRGVPVHGFGNGTETVKRHTGMDTGAGMGMTLDTPQRSAGESVTKLIDQVFELPFHAQLSVMRMIASRVLGAMDARDRENFLNGLRMEMEHTGEDTGVETSEARMTDTPSTPDIQGT